MPLDFPANPTNGQIYDNFYWDSSMGSWRSLSVATVSQVPAGVISQYIGEIAPGGYLLCQGQSVNTADYPALFSVIGYAYGGSGTSFTIPDLRGRIPVGKNSGTFATLGATGGAETVTLSINEMPSHSHGGSTSTDGNHNHSTWGNASSGVASGSNGNYLTNVSRGFTTGDAGSHSHTISSQGGGGAHNNLQPYIVVNYIIKT